MGVLLFYDVIPNLNTTVGPLTDYNNYRLLSTYNCIIISEYLLSIGGHGPSKLTVAILVLLVLSGICAVGWCIYYAASTLHKHHTTRSESEQTVPTSMMETMRNRESNSMNSLYKGTCMYSNTQHHAYTASIQLPSFYSISILKCIYIARLYPLSV